MSFYEPRHPWPVFVVSKDNRPGVVRLVFDPDADEHLIYLVVMDDSGESWCVPSPEVRFQENWTYGRRLKAPKK